MPLKKRRTPQEKKRLSYEKDRRDSYGENDKSRRKNIPLRKKLANRMTRRAGKEMWADDPDKAAGIFRSKLLGRWRKAPDKPLREDVESNMKARELRVGGKTRRSMEMEQSRQLEE